MPDGAWPQARHGRGSTSRESVDLLGTCPNSAARVSMFWAQACEQSVQGNIPSHMLPFSTALQSANPTC